MTIAPAATPLDFDSPQTVVNALRARGMRVSTARRMVLDALFGAERPLSAEQIAGGIGEGRPSLDLASVYRNLETLEAIGVVRHLHVGHGPGRYVLTGSGEREYLACDSCGRLAEAGPGELEAVRSEVTRRFGFRVRFTHFPLVGLCPQCCEREGC